MPALNLSLSTRRRCWNIYGLCWPALRAVMKSLFFSPCCFCHQTFCITCIQQAIISATFRCTGVRHKTLLCVAILLLSLTFLALYNGHFNDSCTRLNDVQVLDNYTWNFSCLFKIKQSLQGTLTLYWIQIYRAISSIAQRKGQTRSNAVKFQIAPHQHQNMFERSFVD